MWRPALVTLVVADLGGLDFDLDVPSFYTAAEPIMPNSYLPKLQCFPFIVTLLGPEQIVAISKCHNNLLFYSIQLSYWISYC